MAQSTGERETEEKGETHSSLCFFRHHPFDIAQETYNTYRERESETGRSGRNKTGLLQSYMKTTDFETQ